MSDRPARGEGDGERLPWLEPYREPAPMRAARSAKAPPARPAKRGMSAGLLAIAGVIAVTAGIGGGYWLGKRDSAVEPAPAATKIAEAPPTPQPAPPLVPELPVVEPETAETATDAVPAEPVVKPVEKPKPAANAKRPVRKAKVRRADARRTQYEKVLAKQREAARTWPKMPSPGPAGQVIQLGAFTTRTRAQNAYRQRLARYPVLNGMPQVVVPVITQPRGEVLYVLRLGTRSRDQSNVVCGNLRRSGDHCLVIG